MGAREAITVARGTTTVSTRERINPRDKRAQNRASYPSRQDERMSNAGQSSPFGTRRAPAGTCQSPVAALCLLFYSFACPVPFRCASTTTQDLHAIARPTKPSDHIVTIKTISTKIYFASKGIKTYEEIT